MLPLVQQKKMDQLCNTCFYTETLRVYVRTKKVRGGEAVFITLKAMASREGVHAAMEGGHLLAFAPPGWLCEGGAAGVQGKCLWELLPTDFCKSHASSMCSSIAGTGCKTGWPSASTYLLPASCIISAHLSTSQQALSDVSVSLVNTSPSFWQELKENLGSPPDLTEPNIVIWLPQGGLNFCQSVLLSSTLSLNCFSKPFRRSLISRKVEKPLPKRCRRMLTSLN